MRVMGRVAAQHADRQAHCLRVCRQEGPGGIGDGGGRRIGRGGKGPSADQGHRWHSDQHCPPGQHGPIIPSRGLQVERREDGQVQPTLATP
jgi:hypothetical protein